jgi:hypothetical protein
MSESCGDLTSTAWVGQEATDAAFRRALNDLGKDGFDRLTRRQRLFHSGDAGSHAGVERAIKTPREECPFLAERVVMAGSAQAHRVTEIARQRGIARSPKMRHRGLKGDTFIELVMSAHSHSTRLASYWNGCYKTFQRLASADVRWDVCMEE